MNFLEHSLTQKVNHAEITVLSPAARGLFFHLVSVAAGWSGEKKKNIAKFSYFQERQIIQRGEDDDKRETEEEKEVCLVVHLVTTADNETSTTFFSCLGRCHTLQSGGAEISHKKATFPTGYLNGKNLFHYMNMKSYILLVDSSHMYDTICNQQLRNDCMRRVS